MCRPNSLLLKKTKQNTNVYTEYVYFHEENEKDINQNVNGNWHLGYMSCDLMFSFLSIVSSFK